MKSLIFWQIIFEYIWHFIQNQDYCVYLSSLNDAFSSLVKSGISRKDCNELHPWTNDKVWACAWSNFFFIALLRIDKIFTCSWVFKSKLWHLRHSSNQFIFVSSSPFSSSTLLEIVIFGKSALAGGSGAWIVFGRTDEVVRSVI